MHSYCKSDVFKVSSNEDIFRMSCCIWFDGFIFDSFVKYKIFLLLKIKLKPINFTKILRFHYRDYASNELWNHYIFYAQGQFKYFGIISFVKVEKNLTLVLSLSYFLIGGHFLMMFSINPKFVLFEFSNSFQFWL